MTIQVPQSSCCHDAKVTRRVSSCSNTRACEAPGFGHVGALEETITLWGFYLAAPVTVWTVTCHLRVFPSLPGGSPLSRSARRLDRGCVTKVNEYALGTAVGQTLWGWGKHLNTLRLRKNGRHFADDIFKYFFLNVNIQQHLHSNYIVYANMGRLWTARTSLRIFFLRFRTVMQFYQNDKMI